MFLLCKLQNNYKLLQYMFRSLSINYFNRFVLQLFRKLWFFLCHKIVMESSHIGLRTFEFIYLLIKARKKQETKQSK